MSRLSFLGQLMGTVGAVFTLVYPFVRSQAVGEIRDGVARMYPGGIAPLDRQLLAQSPWTTGGLLLIALGILLQAASTIWGW